MAFWLIVPFLIIYTGLVGIGTAMAKEQGETITVRKAFWDGPVFVICSVWQMIQRSK